jgi:hypothetical protein
MPSETINLYKFLPMVIKNIVDGFIDDLELVDLYEQFYITNKKNRNSLKSHAILSKQHISYNYIQKQHQKINDTLKSLHKKTTTMDFTNELYCGRINDELGQHSNVDNLTNIYTRYPERYDFPLDFKLFHMLYKSYGCKLQFLNICNLQPCYIFNYLVYNTCNNIYYEKDVYIKDWFIIVSDGTTMGNMVLYMNLNPDSLQFGHIHMYKSVYHNGVKHVFNSFTDFIKNMLKN